MPNDANIAALAVLMAEQLWGVEVHPDSATAAQLRERAEFLASRGVLVPSAITDDEANDASETGFSAVTHEFEYRPAEFRAALERIARGDPA